MAKLGEGDARWIVKEREDGANVNSWHWTTKDVSKHTKSTVAAALEGLTFAAPLDQCRITSAEVDGECRDIGDGGDRDPAHVHADRCVHEPSVGRGHDGHTHAEPPVHGQQ